MIDIDLVKKLAVIKTCVRELTETADPTRLDTTSKKSDSSSTRCNWRSKPRLTSPLISSLPIGRKMYNLADLDIRDYLDRDDFIDRIQAGHDFGPVEALFHQGACSATTEWDGQFVMRNNFEYSKALLHWC